MNELIENLWSRGIAVQEGFLGPDAVDAMVRELLTLRDQGEFRRAGIGRGERYQIEDTVRRDQIFWLPEGAPSPARRELWDKLEALRTTLNRSLFLGLRSFEGHYAIYPPGGFYRKHIDRHEGTSARVLSLVLFLNSEWSPEDHGELRVHTDPLIDILPAPGKLVLFLSHEIPHEVLPTRRERYTFTGWMRSDGPPPTLP